MLRDRTDRAWFSRLLRHPARKRTGSILTALEPALGSATYDFLLTFHSKHGPISYRFREKRQFQSKITNLPQCIKRPRRIGSHWNWVSAIGVKNLE